MKSKKVWLLILLSILLAGCKSTSLATNERIIELKGNPTTGYTWLYTVGDESIIQVEEKITYLGQDGVVGAPSLFTYKIIALREGETTLKFEYKRPWEDKEAEAVRLFEVSVKGAGKIVVREYEL